MKINEWGQKVIYNHNVEYDGKTFGVGDYVEVAWKYILADRIFTTKGKITKIENGIVTLQKGKRFENVEDEYYVSDIQSIKRIHPIDIFPRATEEHKRYKLDPECLKEINLLTECKDYGNYVIQDILLAVEAYMEMHP